ncbi:MAG: hypothetical protein SWO11_16945 [Thermodesulfobacteriota bacterium]|nr:hypothetical protein [Thermodesulfobacteriota bacterium]
MATYAGLTKVGTGAIYNQDFGHFFNLKINLNIATEMAAQTTPAANGYFTIADIIEMANWPARCVPLMGITEVISPSTAAATADIGFAGGQEIEAGFDCDATAGTITGDYYGEGAVAAGFIAGDTIDFEVLTANMADGNYNFFILGLDLLAQ